MRFPFVPAGSSLALFLLVSACGGPPPTRLQSDAAGIAPLREAPAKGVLVVGVLGFPRDIQYFVNGERIEPLEEIPWWDDARLTLHLLPGSYEIEASYRVRAFAGEKTRYRIKTPSPTAVRAGETTYLLARIEKDWRGMPEKSESAFALVDGDEFESTIEAARTASLASSDPTPSDPIPQESNAVGQQANPTDSNEGTAAPSFIIRGSELVSPDEANASSEPPPIGLPSADEPPSEDLPANETERSTSGPGSPVQLSVLVDSDPSGARVYLDERAMGETPLRISMDPSTDHVLRLQHENCSDHVQFVSAKSWERGRSPTITMLLECP